MNAATAPANKSTDAQLPGTWAPNQGGATDPCLRFGSNDLR